MINTFFALHLRNVKNQFLENMKITGNQRLTQKFLKGGVWIFQKATSTHL